MSRHRRSRIVAVALLLLLPGCTVTVLGDAAGERLSLIQDGLDDANKQVAAAVLALTESADRAAAATALDAALGDVDALLEALADPRVAADIGGRSRAVARRLAGYYRHLTSARAAVRRAAHGPRAALRAFLPASRALAAFHRELARIPTQGPLLLLQECGARAPDRYGPGDLYCFAVTSHDGSGNPYTPLVVTAASAVAGVTAGQPTVVSAQRSVYGVLLGPSQGLAEITVAAGGLTRRLFVVNCGKTPAATGGTGLLAVVETPANLVVAGTDRLCWSDASNQPIKMMPRAGGMVTALATRMTAPARLVASAEHLFWLDLRGGISPGGSTGPSVIRVLAQADASGAGIVQLGYGGNAALQLSTDIVVAAGQVYWVVGETSPDTYTIQRIPVGGGTPVDIYTSAWRAITALAADATHLYWIETAYPDAGSILRTPLAGGAAETFYDSPTAIGGGLAIRGEQLHVAELGTGRVIALPLAGGPPQVLAAYTAMPKRLLADDLNLYWIDESGVRALPLAGGDVITLAEGVSASDLCVDGGEVFWSISGGDAHGAMGSVSKAARTGGAATVLASGIRTPVAVAVAGGAVHWCEGGPIAAIEGYGRIAHVARDGGGVLATVNGVSQAMPPLAADAVAVYVADGWTVKRLALDGSASQILASGDFYVTSLAVHSGLAAWVESDPFGMVRCVPTTGGDVRTLGALNDYAGRLTLDATYAYVVGGLDDIHRFPVAGGGGAVVRSGGIIDDLLATGGALCVADIAGNALYRMATGGATTWLGGISGRDWSCRLAAAGTALFWVTSSTVGQTPLSGAPGYILQNGLLSDPGMVVPNSIAADHAYVYWSAVAGNGTGRIFRTAHD